LNFGSHPDHVGFQLGGDLDSLLEDLSRDHIKEDELQQAINIEACKRIREVYSENKPGIEAFSRVPDVLPTRKELRKIDSVFEGDYLQGETTQHKVDPSFYERAVGEPRDELLMDDCVWYDLTMLTHRRLEGSDMDNKTLGFTRKEYLDAEEFSVKRQSMNKQLASRTFNATEQARHLCSTEANLAYVEGLHNRMSCVYGDTFAELFAESIRAEAEAVEVQPDNRSSYPVDAGITAAANSRGADVVTWDSDFLDSLDQISHKEVEVYTPHQAKELW
jgi:hypothetical protein